MLQIKNTLGGGGLKIVNGTQKEGIALGNIRKGAFVSGFFPPQIADGDINNSTISTQYGTPCICILGIYALVLYTNASSQSAQVSYPYIGLYKLINGRYTFISSTALGYQENALVYINSALAVSENVALFSAYGIGYVVTVNSDDTISFEKSSAFSHSSINRIGFIKYDDGKYALIEFSSNSLIVKAITANADGTYSSKGATYDYSSMHIYFTSLIYVGNSTFVWSGYDNSNYGVGLIGLFYLNDNGSPSISSPIEVRTANIKSERTRNALISFDSAQNNCKDILWIDKHSLSQYYTNYMVFRVDNVARTITKVVSSKKVPNLPQGYELSGYPLLAFCKSGESFKISSVLTSTSDLTCIADVQYNKLTNDLSCDGYATYADFPYFVSTTCTKSVFISEDFSTIAMSTMTYSYKFMSASTFVCEGTNPIQGVGTNNTLGNELVNYIGG